MIVRFLKWWTAELAALMPGAGRERGHGAGQCLVLELDDEQVRVRMTGARGRARVARRGDAKLVSEAVTEVANGVNPARTRCQVRVPPELALVRTVTLPLAAEENLREVLGFEMDRQTPFRASDVYFDYRVLDRNRARQQLSVQLMVVKRALVEPLLAALEHWGLRPAQGEAQPTPEAGATLEFVPSGFKARSSSAFNGAMALVVLALAASAVYLPLKAQREQREALEQAVERARVEAAEAMALRARLDAKHASVRILSEARGGRPAMVELLETLSQALPDHTYLSRFEVRGDQLSIQGNSDAASTLIAILESNELLRDVRFASPVTRDPRSGGERFHISATVAPSPSAPAPALEAKG